MFDFNNYFDNSKNYGDSNALVVGKMKDEMGGEFVGLKRKIFSILMNSSSEYKKTKGVNENVVAKKSHNGYKGVLLNKKCLRHLINRIEGKDHRIRTYEIKKYLCFAMMTNFIFLILELMH